MAIYDNLKDKLTQTSQSAVSRVRDLSETVRLNTEIGDIENQINDLYCKMGYEIYVAYKDRPIEEVKGLISEVTELHERIEESKQLIQAMQAVNTCPNCGNRIKPGMIFCSSCGTKLPESEEVEEPVERAAFCSKCGAPIVGDASFCMSCGEKLE